MVGWIKGFGTGSVIQKFIPELQIKNEENKIKSILIFILSFSLLSSVLFLLLFTIIPEGLINSYFKNHLAKSVVLILFVFVVLMTLIFLSFVILLFLTVLFDIILYYII